MAMYGKTDAKVTDIKAWAEHDHGKSWSDGGQVEKILSVAAGDLQQLIADETKAAVSDYICNSQMVLGVSPDGKLLVGCRLWNEDANIVARTPFLELVLAAINEIRPNIAQNAEGQALLSAIVDVGNKLANIGRSNSQPLPRAARNGTHQANAVRTPVRPARPTGDSIL